MAYLLCRACAPPGVTFLPMQLTLHTAHARPVTSQAGMHDMQWQLLATGSCQVHEH